MRKVADMSAGERLDFETDVCELRNMALIASSMVENALECGKEAERSHSYTYSLSKEEVEAVLFCVYEVDRRAKALKTKFYAGLDVARGAREAANV